MQFTDLLDNQLFFTVLLKNTYFFETLKGRYPEILADLVSSRDNPNCSCKNRVRNYLTSKLESDASFFHALITNQEILSILNSNNFNTADITQSHPSRGIPHMHRHGKPKIYRIPKDDRSWYELAERIKLENPFLKSFYVSEKTHELVVYVI